MTHATERNRHLNRRGAFALLLSAAVLLAACATTTTAPRTTKRDKTAKGAGVGAAAGALGAVLAGEDEADEILAGAAIGAVVGGGVGVYLDRQEEKLARIPGTTVERIDRETLLVHFDNDVLFDVDSAALRPDARTTLTDVAGVLTDFPKTAVVIQGHTDSTGSNSHNRQLSRARAESVESFLVTRGVDPSRTSAAGFGEEHPIATNDTERGRQQNRRVDLMLRAKAI